MKIVHRLLFTAFTTAALLAGNAASAATVTYVLTGNLTGTIGTTTLSGNAFQFTITADISGGSPAVTSNSIYIAGVGSGTFGPLMSFAFSGAQGSFIQDSGFPFPVVSFTSPALSGWNGSAPLPPGPATQSSPGSWTAVQTTLGTLSITGITNASFSAASGAAPAPLTVMTPSALSSGTINIYYAHSLAANGGTPPYTWSLVSGVLPAGLSLSAAGAIAGTPTALGTLNFTAKVTDAASTAATQAFSLTIGSTQSFSGALRIPEIADGGGWKTRFAIVNLDQVPVTFTFQFWGVDGSALPFPILNGTAGVLSQTLAPGASFYAESPGTSPVLQQGWAEVASGGRVGVTVIFQFSDGSARDSVGTTVATLSGRSIVVPFDNTHLNATSVAVVNTNPSQAIQVSMLAVTDTGTQSASSFILLPHSQQAFVVQSLNPGTAGFRGSLQFTAPTADLAVLGLEFTPKGQFTSLGTFQ